MHQNFTAQNEREQVPDSFQAFLVEGAHFSSCEEYPIIEPEMISKEIPQDIMPFNKAINYRGDLSKTFICFYSPDETFERIRRNPQQYVNFFKRTAGIIGFDYSIHSDMPIVKQKAQIYDNLALTYYYGKHGIPVIPNVRSGVDDITSEFLECIPKKSTIAIGAHGFVKEMREKYEWYVFLKQIINVLNPETIVVYGNLSNKMFDDFKQNNNFVFYPAWIANRWGRYKDVN